MYIVYTVTTIWIVVCIEEGKYNFKNAKKRKKFLLTKIPLILIRIKTYLDKLYKGKRAFNFH